MVPSQDQNIIRCSSWREFAHERIIEYLQQHLGDLVFRGHADTRWPLESSLVRLLRTEHQAFLLDDLEDAATWSIAEFQRGLLDAGANPALVGDGLAVQALAQHYGLPTSLLDWSMSPFTAAYFAFSEIIQQRVTSSEIAIWMLDTHHHLIGRSDGTAGDKLGQLVWFRPGAYGNDRLRNQFGSFTLLRSELLSIELFVAHKLGDDDPSPLVKFVLPAEDAESALSELAFMGIADDRLFPGVDQLAFRIAQRLRERLREPHHHRTAKL